MKDIEYDLADVIIERPQEFKVGRRYFKLYPVTLAKMLLLKRHLDGLKLNMEILKTNIYLEAMRLARESRESCCNILAYHTAPNSYKELYNSHAITIRKNYFTKYLSDEELASLVTYILSATDKTDELLRYVGLEKEKERLTKVMEVKRKHNKSSLSFNGLSLFGTFIGQLKEMGYTDNEILYEKGYTFLRLMLADKVVTVMLTDEERENLDSDIGGTLIDANDPAKTDKIAQILSSKGLRIE